LNNVPSENPSQLIWTVSTSVLINTLLTLRNKLKNKKFKLKRMQRRKLIRRRKRIKRKKRRRIKKMASHKTQ
jgi:HJR/Mrr/RecB family endonuclease